MLIFTHIIGRLFLCMCQTRWHHSTPGAHLPCLVITVELDVPRPAKLSIHLRKDTYLSFLSYMHIPEAILGTPIMRLSHMLTQEVETGCSDWHCHLDHWEWGGLEEDEKDAEQTKTPLSTKPCRLPPFLRKQQALEKRVPHCGKEHPIKRMNARDFYNFSFVKTFKPIIQHQTTICTWTNTWVIICISYFQ